MVRAPWRSDFFQNLVTGSSLGSLWVLMGDQVAFRARLASQILNQLDLEEDGWVDGEGPLAL